MSKETEEIVLPDVDTYEALRAQLERDNQAEESRLYKSSLKELLERAILATKRLVKQGITEEVVQFQSTKTPQEEARRAKVFEEVKSRLEAAGWIVKADDAVKFWIRRK